MLKLYREALGDMKCYVNKDTIFYDIFGGSGLLAHETKRQFQNNKVIWNDYDNFQKRLDILDKTEGLRLKIVNIIKDKRFQKEERIKGIERQKIEKLLKEEGEFDYIQLSSWLRFGGAYAKDCEDFF